MLVYKDFNIRHFADICIVGEHLLCYHACQQTTPCDCEGRGTRYCNLPRFTPLHNFSPPASALLAPVADRQLNIILFVSRMISEGLPMLFHR